MSESWIWVIGYLGAFFMGLLIGSGRRQKQFDHKVRMLYGPEFLQHMRNKGHVP